MLSRTRAIANKRKHFSKKTCSRRYAVYSMTERFHKPAEIEDISNLNESFQVSKVNGASVITFDTPSPVIAASAFVKAGSRYESKYTRGTSHYLKHFAFKNTNNFLAIDSLRELETNGLDYNSTFGRDFIGYHVAGPTGADNISIVAKQLQNVLTPSIWEFEVDEARESVKKELEIINQDGPTIVLEKLYQLAYQNSGLGQSQYAPPYAPKKLVAQHIVDHLRRFYTLDNVVYVASGVNHSEFTEKLDKLVNYDVKYIGVDLELEAYDPLPEVPLTPQNVDYLGGQNSIEGSSGHVGVAFQGKATPAYSVLKELLSIKQLDGAEYSSVFNSVNIGRGLFGVYAATNLGSEGKVVGSILDAVRSLGSVTDAEISQAKNNAARKLLVENEDNVTQLQNLAYQHWEGSGLKNTAEQASEILAVTAADIKEVVGALTSARPSVVTIGDIKNIPQL
eukprot:TRINITY_DN1612_c0_g1_i1.p1 TRINITY_DN1612_c0_g1~~TRINITY_DN1612_c0_g1_i1.p1  ORF type:complete len:451 (-),score=131.83 TRINITY_DN1612_c0_g1_i1:82-1434(-)